MCAKHFALLVLAATLTIAGCSSPPATPEKPPEPAKAEKIGKPLPLKGGYGIRAMFAPDNKTVAVVSADLPPGQTNYVQIFNTATGEPVAEPDKGVHHVFFSPDGETFATMYPLQLWDARTGKPIGGPLEQQEANERLSPFSPDGKTLLTSNGETARLLDARTGQAIGKPLEHEARFMRAVFSPDGKRILTMCANHKKAYLWDATTGNPIGKPLEHPLFARSAVFSPDGRMVLTVCGQGFSDHGEVQLWEVATCQPIGLPLYKGDLDFFDQGAFGPDGKTFFIRPRGPLQLYKTATQKPIDLSPAPTGSVAYSPDGRFLVEVVPLLVDGLRVGEKFTVWDIATGKAIDKPINPFLKYLGSNRVLTAVEWQLATGRHFPLADKTFNTVAISADGTIAVTDGQVWDTATWTEICKPLEPATTSDVVARVFLSPDKRTLLTVGHFGPLFAYMGIKDQAQLWRLSAAGK